MRDGLDAILRTLEEAQRQIQSARSSHADAPEHAGALDEVEQGLIQILEKLDRLKDKPD